MKTIYIYTDKRTGEVVVEHDATMSPLEVFSALADASRTVYQTIIDNEERKRKLSVGTVNEVLELMTRQKHSKLN